MTTVFWAHLAAMEQGERGEMGSERRVAAAAVVAGVSFAQADTKHGKQRAIEASCPGGDCSFAEACS
jgi:hypothetical protein